MDTIRVDGWEGRLGKGLAPRELEATLYCAEELTAKEAARKMGCSHYTVSQLLENARFKLGMQRTCRGLLLEAMKRGIIAPLAIALCIAGAFTDRPNYRPVRQAPVARLIAAPRTQMV